MKNPVQCNIPNCLKDFDTVFAYESHYHACHINRCKECHKNLPNAHLLDLHLLEAHDAYFALQSRLKPMFSCYVKECKIVSNTPEQRKDHCVRDHQFPSNFRFEIRPPKCRHFSEYDDDPMVDADAAADKEVDELTKKVKDVSFGLSSIKMFKQDGLYARNQFKEMKANQPPKKDASKKNGKESGNESESE